MHSQQRPLHGRLLRLEQRLYLDEVEVRLLPRRATGGRGVHPVADLNPPLVGHGPEDAIGVVPAGRVRTGTIALLDVLSAALAKERYAIEIHRLRVLLAWLDP